MQIKFDFVQNQIFMFWSIFNQILPYQSKFRNLLALLSCLDLKEEIKIKFAIKFDFILYFWI